MKADFTRLVYRPEDQHASVRLQQGRVLLDADWNAQIDLQAHRDQTTTRDVVGACVAPFHLPGTFENFKLRAVGADFQIASGRIYVDGILCENDAAHPGSDQPGYWKDAPIIVLDNGTRAKLPAPKGIYLAYLDVWHRHLTYLDDDAMREVALGGPDTTTRTKTIWQVNLHPLNKNRNEINCAQFRDWQLIQDKELGTLAARAEPVQNSGNDCIVPPGAGYRRLENQLYRVEVHDSGNLDEATFKWSRDNGTVVAQWLAQDQNELTVSEVGRDTVLSFAPGQWIELSDDNRELIGQPGVLAQLDKVNGNILTIKMPNPPIKRADFPINPKVRRWDSSPTLKIEIPATNDGWIPLEDGVQVKFEKGFFRSGDYWLIPARTLTADVEWQKVNNQPALQPPHGIAHHYGALALGEMKADGTLEIFSDCRAMFPEMNLFYISGDGQEAMPGAQLPKPLQVGVSNGQQSIPGARVQFRISAGSGSLQPGNANFFGGSTNSNGVAECAWTLDANTPSQQVEAILLDDEKNPVGLPVRFNANLSTANQVAYDPSNCSNLKSAQVKTVQQAIDVLCQSGGREPGFSVVDTVLTANKRPLRNDMAVQINELVDGFLVFCKTASGDGVNIDPVSINRASVYVTVELPISGQSAASPIWGGAPVGFQPIVLAGTVRGANDNIAWQPDKVALEWLSAMLPKITSGLRDPRILTRVTLKGNMIWDLNKPDLYLDGNVFGMRRDPVNVDARWPSGDGRRGGDFEMWFWLTTILGIGVIPNLKSRFFADARFVPAFNLGLDRTQLASALPPGYVIDGSQRFNAIEAAKAIEIAGMKGASVRIIAAQSLSVLGNTLARLISANTGLKVNADALEDPILVDKVRALLAGGDQVDAILGDENLAQRLAQVARDFFDGRIIRI